jgi:cyclopentanol dehydrogenase
MRLEGKVALISGGARGQGAAEAKLFAREAAKVVIGDVLEKEGQQTEAEINEAGGEALFIRLDVTKAEDWRRAMETTVARFGKLNVLVNNAGIPGAQRRLGDYTEEEWYEVHDVDIKSVFLGTKYAIPEMSKAGGGSIINISSIAGISHAGGSAGYAAAKAGVRLLSKATTVEYGSEGIRANSILPGAVDTLNLRQVIGENLSVLETVKQIAPLGRLTMPEDIAYAALFLASDESSMIAGADLVIDGGTMAQTPLGRP